MHRERGDAEVSEAFLQARDDVHRAFCEFGAMSRLAEYCLVDFCRMLCLCQIREIQHEEGGAQNLKRRKRVRVLLDAVTATLVLATFELKVDVGQVLYWQDRNVPC